jgi:anti-sigma regulatory factor (Ser/Thr protein kinase)
MDPLRLDPLGESVAIARRYVRDAVLALGHEHLLDSAVLGVSELVTNACLHARTALTVVVAAAHPHGVRITVTDGSPTLPTQRRHGRTAATGRGLRLLDTFGRWGVESAPEGKAVWFEPVEQPEDSTDAEERWDAGGLTHDR